MALIRTLTHVLVGLALTGALAGPAAGAAAFSDPDPPELSASWPDEGANLWVPVKEGWLRFSTPVRASSTAASVLGGPEPVTLTRITRGEAVDTVLFRFPELPPGAYRLNWSTTSDDGRQLSGEQRFTVPEPFSAPGGGNHRDHTIHFYIDTVAALSLRALLVVSAGLILAVTRRPKSWRTDLGARLGSLLLAGVAAAWGVVDLVHAVVDSADRPVLTAAITPAAWVFFPVAGLGLLRTATGLSPRQATQLAVAAVTATAVVSVAMTAVRPLLAFPLVLVAGTGTALLASSLAARARQRRLVLGAAAAAAAASLGLVYLHAWSLTLRGLFRDDLRHWVIWASVLLLAAVSSALLPSGRAWRIPGLALGLVTVVSASALLHLPAPVVGL